MRNAVIDHLERVERHTAEGRQQLADCEECLRQLVILEVVESAIYGKIWNWVFAIHEEPL